MQTTIGVLPSLTLGNGGLSEGDNWQHGTRDPGGGLVRFPAEHPPGFDSAQRLHSKPRQTDPNSG